MHRGANLTGASLYRKAQMHQQQTLLRQPRVTERTGIPRSSIYAAIRAGTFPAPIKIGERAVAWVSTDIENWIAKCAEQRV